MNTDQSIKDFVAAKNSQKIVFTPGPGSLTEENIMGLGPCFSRSDDEYLATMEHVHSKILELSGQKHVASFQGSGTLAIEIAINNFVSGKVVIVSTGFYSNRVADLTRAFADLYGIVTEVVEVDWKDLDTFIGDFDWVLACPTETSVGLLVPISELHAFSEKCGARLFLDATASIGLEAGHELAEVVTFSSCKGLFGLTGGSFIAHNNEPTFEPKNFYMKLGTHANKRTTGAYHAIQSLFHTLNNHEDLKQSVITNKAVFTTRFADQLIYPEKNQPLLCTQISGQIVTDNPDVVLYASRHPIEGSVVCHIGELHLGSRAQGKIIDELYVANTL